MKVWTKMLGAKKQGTRRMARSGRKIPPAVAKMARAKPATIHFAHPTRLSRRRSNGDAVTACAATAGRFQSSVRMQHPAAGFRQREGGNEEHAIGGNGKHGDRVGERRRCREPSDQERKQGADATAEIVAEALPRSAQPCRKQFGEERADAGEVARREESEREA